MIVLRTLITTNITAQLALNSTNPREASCKGLAIGLFTYLNLQSTLLALPTGITTGVIATVPPVPGNSLIGGTIAIQSYEILYQKLLDYTKTNVTLLNPLSHIGIFRAIQEYLEIHLINVSPSGVPIQASVGTGLIKFPVMSLLGISCWATMTSMGAIGLLNKEPTTGILDKQFEILSNFIFIGLNHNLIPPISTVGTIGSAYTGITFLKWFFLDLPDWPVNSASYLDLLNSFGLTSLDDLSNLLYEAQEETSSLDECGITFNSIYECPTDCSNITPTILTSALGSSANTSEYSLTGGDLCDQVNSINNALISSGLTSAATLSSSYGVTEVPPYEDISVGSFSTNKIDFNINIFRITVKLNLAEEIDRTPPSFATTGII